MRAGRLRGLQGAHQLIEGVVLVLQEGRAQRVYVGATRQLQLARYPGESAPCGIRIVGLVKPVFSRDFRLRTFDVPDFIGIGAVPGAPPCGSRSDARPRITNGSGMECSMKTTALRASRTGIASADTDLTAGAFSAHAEFRASGNRAS